MESQPDAVSVQLPLLPDWVEPLYLNLWRVTCSQCGEPAVVATSTEEGRPVTWTCGDCRRKKREK